MHHHYGGYVRVLNDKQAALMESCNMYALMIIPMFCCGYIIGGFVFAFICWRMQRCCLREDAAAVQRWKTIAWVLFIGCIVFNCCFGGIYFSVGKN